MKPPRTTARAPTPWRPVAVAAVASAALAAVLVRGLEPAPAGGPPGAVETLDAGSASELRRALELLEQRVARIEAGIASMRAPERQPVGGAEVDLDRLIRRLRDAGFVGAEHAAEGAPQHDVDGTLARLLALGPGEDAQRLWDEVRRAGAMEEMVAAFERWAAANPGSAEARVDLGMAYVQQLLSVPDGAEKARIGVLADQAFSAALELDPGSWRARFCKAEGMSYAPAVSGKQAEAMQHFEVLVEQQAGMRPRAEHVRTYVMLGNLYERAGQLDKAREVWAKGFARHPDDPELRKRAGAAGR